VGTVILPVQIPLIIAYALSYTVIYANGANAFYHLLGFLPPTAPVAMPVLYAAGDVPAWQVAVSAALVAVGTAWMARTAATIYGRSILRTGSRVRLREVLARSASRLVCPAGRSCGTVTGWTGSNGTSGTPGPASNGRCTRTSS
jgi:ABC-type Na+ efflux pump permease subunit